MIYNTLGDNSNAQYPTYSEFISSFSIAQINFPINSFFCYQTPFKHKLKDLYGS